MFDVGRICIKLAGRDAGKKCVVVEVIDHKTVLVDGETRRRNSNVLHLEPLKETLNIKKGASHADIKVAFGKIGVEVLETKPKKAEARPIHIRKGAAKEKKVVEAKIVKETKKEKAAPKKKAKTEE